MVPFKTQTPKVIDDPNVLASRCPGIGIIFQNKKTVQFATNDSPLFKPKRSTKLVQASSLLDVCRDIQVNKIFSKSDRRKRISPNRSRRIIASLRSLASTDILCGMYIHLRRRRRFLQGLGSVHAVTLADSFLLRKARLESIASLVAYRHAEHVEDFVFILRSIAEVSSPSSPVYFLSAPHCQRSPALPLNDPRPNEEEVENSKADTRRAQIELSTYRFCVPLKVSNPEAECDAMLAAEFAAFSFDSGDVLEWSDEVEREKQMPTLHMSRRPWRFQSRNSPPISLMVKPTSPIRMRAGSSAALLPSRPRPLKQHVCGFFSN